MDASFSGETLQMRELVFARSLSLYEQHQRSLLINPTKHRIGHAIMTEQQRDGWKMLATGMDARTGQRA